MIFAALWDSARQGELILLEGGLCRWHLRADGQVTVREIISLRPGRGQALLVRLRAIPGATSILARCPVDLEANGWWRRRGFVLLGTVRTMSGRAVNVSRLSRSCF